MGTIYSAEITTPSAKFERRIKIVNRLTGERYYRPFRERADQASTPANIDRSLRDKVREIHTSPFLIVEMLWYDPQLELLFFEVTTRRNEYGCKITDQQASV